ncbi:PP2C family protein-serine/threonine phosphatase [Cryptosporangium aurantiacum]|uniref:Sigma-B regulation protein RsbU (Phosphoserine phosphatase) n=1 Tax=Cryptosporangium aurantiacum TaxID=134849 RepID=A0A1M7QE71_9ACTN|nr:GAF domain-containing SpoIIE family protein phosphatase [Cryptosporangium aurantiacum]SHN28973.1 sigma-B regulation protein RsbU (phosphoserine phosphatase) [Cryptosporangium aurantiacum]
MTDAESAASAGDQARPQVSGLIPPNEAERLRAVRRYDILDTPPDGAFDRIAALAARIFEVPVATVTIVDEDRIWFKATHGVDVTQIGRDPGLCASAILVDGPTAIEDATLDPVAYNNPLVRGEFGLRYYAAAPITTSDGYNLGTVNVIDRVPRQTGDTELETLGDLASIVVDELELRLSAIREVRLERRRREEVQRSKGQVEEVARTLQQTLLPPRMPQVPGMELSAFYHAAPLQEVGGDFYDVFPLGGRRWAISIGDVSGKGVNAAALTSLARYALRGAAIQTSDPSLVMAALNETIVADQAGQDVPRYCTAVFCVIEQTDSGSAQVRLANGGHPPAVVCRADGSIERLTESGPMLGWLPDSQYPTLETLLGPGDGLLFYTDGITDARRYGQRFGEGRLAAALADRPHNNAKSLVRWVRNLMNEFDPPGYDDVAVISISVEPAPVQERQLTGLWAAGD